MKNIDVNNKLIKSKFTKRFYLVEPSHPTNIALHTSLQFTADKGVYILSFFFFFFFYRSIDPIQDDDVTKPQRATGCEGELEYFGGDQKPSPRQETRDEALLLFKRLGRGV